MWIEVRRCSLRSSTQRTGWSSASAQRGEHHLLRREPRLDAEAAADIGRDDPDTPLLEPEHLRQAEAKGVRCLRRAVDDELVEAMVAIGKDRAALERHGRLAVHAVARRTTIAASRAA